MKIFKALAIWRNIKLSLVAYLCLTAGLLLSDATVLFAQTSASAADNNDRVITVTNSLQSVANTRVLQAEQWEVARSGESILSIPVLNQVVNELLLDKDKKIEIQYPGGEEGELWVQQLTDWLVALGIPSHRMMITPGSGADDIIKFDIIK